MNTPRHAMAAADVYGADPAGTALVRLRDLTPDHKRRVIEIRHPDGTGRAGALVDAAHYLLEGVVGLRLDGDRDGFFGDPDDQVRVWPDGTTKADVATFYAQEGGDAA